MLNPALQQTNLGAMLAAYRTARGLSLRELARETGISFSTLQRIEQGNSVELMTWLRLQYWLLSPANNDGGLALKNGFNQAQAGEGISTAEQIV